MKNVMDMEIDVSTYFTNVRVYTGKFIHYTRDD